jgi:hypothetical protein
MREMKSGLAKIRITPDTPRIQVFGMMSKGNIHDIWARCLTLNDGQRRMVVITYDLNCLDVATPILRERCAKELGISAGLLVLLATHNHNAPIQIVPDNFDYGRSLADTLFDLVQTAIADESGPVTVKFGSGSGEFVWAVGNAPADTEIQVLTVAEEDKPKAILFTHPVHPLLGAIGYIEPGHPGYACEALEEEFPGCLALYADACGGNQFAIEPDIDGDAMAKAKALGQHLAALVVGVVGSPMTDVTGPIEGELDVVSLPLAPPIPREEAEELLKSAPCDDVCVPYPDERRAMNWVRVLNEYYKQGKPFPKRTDDLVCTDDAFLVDAHKDGRAHPCRYEEVIIARIGPMPFIAMQGEVCAPIGMRIKDAFRQRMPIFATAYMGEHNLYIPTRELVRTDSYQSQVLRIQYASPVDWDPNVEDEMVHGVIGRVKKLMNDTEEPALVTDYLAVRMENTED